MDITAALPTFVITLREGVEAALVVGIVLAYLKKAGQDRLNTWVYAGIASGVAASVLIGILFNGVMLALAQSDRPYAPVIKPLLEGIFGVGAIVLLTWMLIWMTQQARSLKGEIEGAVSTALQKTDAGWGIFSLILIAVLREGFETVVFISAQFQQGWLPVAGAIAGLLGATGIGFLLFRLGVKINLRQFFQFMGVLLLLIVSGLVVGALRHFNGAVEALAQVDPQFATLCPATRASCILGGQVWDLSQVLPDRQFPGILLKSFLGYTQRLYWVQAIAYLTFLLTVGSLYLQSIGSQVLPPSATERSPLKN
ncbi:MAG: FTR1 family protein [Oscillatoriophycideae cyanobacterium NC_groundwater_1537_Pr4_S-0.65um_50_18]|nr:FTR1 family protein [Oscillatoriophycideae cyanobacterium NC_groundwater_1537_Pr4_S-0.65um_50_18]